MLTLVADIKRPSLIKISNLPTLMASINTERHDVKCKCTWWHKDGGDLFLFRVGGLWNLLLFTADSEAYIFLKDSTKVRTNLT